MADEANKAVAPAAVKAKNLKCLVDIHHKPAPYRDPEFGVINPRVKIIKKGTVIAPGHLGAKDVDRMKKNGHLEETADAVTPEETAAPVAPAPAAEPAA